MRKVALDTVHQLAKRDPRVVFVGSDLGAGTLNKMREEFPDRWFMEGISEQAMIGMSAGLAMDGFVPYLNTIAPFFTRRAYEQIAIDVALHNLPVRMISSGGGVVYAPLGPTHLAIDDIGAMRLIPNMTVVAPCDAQEMGRLMEASLNWQGPMYIRLAKGGDAIVSDDSRGFEIGKAIVVCEPGDVLLVVTGVMLQKALKVAEILAQKGINCGILHMHTIKPLDQNAILQRAGQVQLLVTMEEHSCIGGLGSAVVDALVDNMDRLPRILRLSLPDVFPKEYGSQDTMFDTFGLTAEKMAEKISLKLTD